MFRRFTFGVMLSVGVVHVLAIQPATGQNRSIPEDSFEVRGQWSQQRGVETSFGWYPSREAAEAYVRETNQSYSGGLLIAARNKPTGLYIIDRRSKYLPKDENKESTEKFKKHADRVLQATDYLGRVKEAKEAVDHAKKVTKGEAPLVKVEEQRVGDTTNEYKDMIAQVSGFSNTAKKTLTNGVAANVDAKFNKANRVTSDLFKDAPKITGTPPLPGFNGSGTGFQAYPFLLPASSGSGSNIAQDATNHPRAGGNPPHRDTMFGLPTPTKSSTPSSGYVPYFGSTASSSVNHRPGSPAQPQSSRTDSGFPRPPLTTGQGSSSSAWTPWTLGQAAVQPGSASSHGESHEELATRLARENAQRHANESAKRLQEAADRRAREDAAQAREKAAQQAKEDADRRARDAAAQKRQQMQAAARELEQQLDRLRSENAELEREDAELERERARLDHTDHHAVDQFNTRVENWNSRVESWKARRDNLKSRMESLQR